MDFPSVKVMSVRKLSPTIPAAALGALLVLTGCQEAGTEATSEQPTVSPEVATPVETPDSAPEVTVVDTSPGGPIEVDPVWSGLQNAAQEGQEAYLDVHLHTYQEPGAEDPVTLTPSTPNSMTITVPAEALDSENAPFYRVAGTFTVEGLGSSAYALTAENTDEISELQPSGPDTEERCTADDASERTQQAAQQLVESPDTREELRLLWASAPAVWWGIQRTALTLQGSDGDVAGDFFTEGCGPYLE